MNLFSLLAVTTPSQVFNPVFVPVHQPSVRTSRFSGVAKAKRQARKRKNKLRGH